MQQDAFVSHFKSLRRIGYKPPNHRIDLAPQDALVGSGETGVTEKRGSAREYLFIRGLYMRMRSDHRGNSPIQHSRNGNFLGGRFGMEIEKHDRRFLAQPIDP